MKMASATLLLVVLVASMEASAGFRLMRSATGRNASQQVKAAAPKASGSAAEPKAAAAAAHAAPLERASPGAARVVEVPVVEVVVVDGGEMEKEAMPRPGVAGLPAADVNGTCREELAELTSSDSRRARANACVDRSDSTQRVLRALQQANASEAEAVALATLRQCGGLSRACAGQVAAQTVLNLRLSGLSVSRECAVDVAKAMRQGPRLAPAESARCRGNVTREVFRELAGKDMEGAIAAAQRGLSACNGVGHPCDYQLAPMMVMQLLRSAKEEEQVQVLMRGLARAGELAVQVARLQAAERAAARGRARAAAAAKGPAGAKESGAGGLANASAPAASVAAGAPKLSLLSLARHLRRIAAPARTVTL